MTKWYATIRNRENGLTVEVGAWSEEELDDTILDVDARLMSLRNCSVDIYTVEI